MKSSERYKTGKNIPIRNDGGGRYKIQWGHGCKQQDLIKVKRKITSKSWASLVRFYLVTV